MSLSKHLLEEDTGKLWGKWTISQNKTK